MGKIRTVKKTNYSVISNSILWDKRLSVKARFVLIFCLSLADGWEYNVIGLAKSLGISSDAVTKCLKELEEFGYLKRQQLFDDRKKFAGYDYMFYEDGKANGDGVLSYTEKPYTELSYTENPAQLNTKELNTKESNNNNINININAVNVYTEHIHPTPSSTLAIMITDLVEDVGLSIFTEACVTAESENKRSFAYVRACALNAKNGNTFKEKQKAVDEDYWAYMLKGVTDDGDKQD